MAAIEFFISAIRIELAMVKSSCADACTPGSLTESEKHDKHIVTQNAHVLGELEEVGIASLTGVNVETNPEMEVLMGVSVKNMNFLYTVDSQSVQQKRFCFTLFTSSNSYALSAPSLKELQAWTTKLDPTRLLS